MKPRRQAKTLTGMFTVNGQSVQARFTRIAKWQQVEGPISTGPFYTTKAAPDALFLPEAAYLFNKTAPAIPFMHRIEN